MFLLSTKIGAYLIFKSITYYIPGLSFDTISGSWGKFNITHVIYRTSVSVINIGTCSISINIKHIWNKKIYINHLYLKDVLIKIKKNNFIFHNSQTNNTHNNIMSIALPITLNDVVLHNVHIISDIIMLQFNKISTSLSFQNKSLIISPTCFTETILNISNTHISQMQSSIKTIHQYTNKSVIQSLLESISNKCISTLSILKIPFNIVLSDLKGEKFYINNINKKNYLIRDLHLQMRFCQYDMNVQFHFFCINGLFHTSGNIKFKEYYPIDIITNFIPYKNGTDYFSIISSKNIKKINLIITGELYKTIYIKCNYLNFLAELEVLLQTNIKKNNIPISISIIGKNISFPYLRKNRLFIKTINFYLQGNKKNYYLQVTSELCNSKFLSSTNIMLYAQGDINNCTISNCRISTLNSYFHMTGAINWSNTINWDIKCTLSKFSMFSNWLKDRVQLSGQIITQGFLCNNAWEITISNVDLKGFVKNNHLVCIGSLYNNSNGLWKIPTKKLVIQWGHSALEINESLKNHLIFNTILKISNFNFFNSKLNGKMNGRLKLHGTIKNIKLSLNTDTVFLNWLNKNICINTIILNGNIFYKSFMQGVIFLQANNIKYGSMFLYKFIMQGHGNLKKHFFNMKICGDKLFGDIQLYGNLNVVNNTWCSKIQKTSVITPIGTWKLMKDIVFTYQYLIGKIIVSSHYWEFVNCNITIPNILKNKITNKIDTFFNNINLAPLKILFPELIKIQSVNVVCTECSWILGDLLPKGTILISGKDLQMNTNIQSYKTTVIPSIFIKVTLIQDTSYFAWQINYIDKNDENYGFLAINNNTSNISGHIKIRSITLIPFFNSLIVLEKPINFTGLLNINVSFSRHMNHLMINGFAQLQNINFSLFTTPFIINHSQLFVKFSGDHATFNGAIYTDNGDKLSLNGNVFNFDSFNKINISLRMKGEQINFCVSPEIKLKISPDITCLLASKKIHVQGNVDIPWAYVNIKESVKNVTRISSEEIILDDHDQPIINNFNNLKVSVTCNITTCLGETVYFNGLGVSAQLKGKIKIIFNEKNRLSLTGLVYMKSGNFQIYGQYLIIKKGQLLFSGLIDQPYLDIEAICDQSNINIRDNTVVGIRITGVLNNPKLEIFSNSSSYSSQKFIYLLGDKNSVPLGKDENIATSLLIGASVRNSEKFIDKIGKILGVKDLKLNTHNIGSDPLIALSGYIAPGLQFKYGISIFDWSTIVTVRYLLYPKLYLEMTSGNNQAFDILYKFEF
ncbi:translocation/assembly module TamB domain-containing protein [Candidatus Blochmannia ocreatus (nom. nud.)]|uniref:Translocation/assembly module TamB domain-containing protein n=1 Tax=Candidatus Blochmannia ocreatus (nom. nud.) TaxID=251538 RepID=A0ABY4ST80_9ENTR|nr:translocation/assembly module TamB domain-containing protein [Candidatus Blochmannia ocreatus]URJ25175.1 translocation/assembly module TamB domain-containing protein [Candidatus Blochmannia ocreatus]